MEGYYLEILLFFVATFSYILGQLAGGGAALIYTPLLIFLGIDPRIAIASSKAASFGGISGVWRYIKSGKIVWRHVPAYIIISVCASILGSRILISLDAGVAQTVFGILVLFVLPFIFFKSSWGLENLTHKISQTHESFGFLLYTLISIVQAGFGGVGLLVTYVLVTFFGYTIIEANATRRVPLIILNATAFLSFLLSGFIDYSLAITFLLASLTGNYLGAHLAIKKGNKVVKTFFMAFVLISAIKLLFF